MAKLKIERGGWDVEIGKLEDLKRKDIVPFEKYGRMFFSGRDAQENYYFLRWSNPEQTEIFGAIFEGKHMYFNDEQKIHNERSPASQRNITVCDPTYIELVNSLGGKLK